MQIELTEEEIKVVRRAFTVLENNIRYSLTAPPEQLARAIREVANVKEKFDV